MKTIKQSYLINSSIESVWKALVDPKEIEKWGGGPVKMDAKVGTKFSLWGGEIHGKNIEVAPLKKLRQEWYGGKWSEPSYATFTLSQEKGKTTVELLQQNVLDREEKDLADGWNRYYLGEIKRYLENE